MAEEEYDVPFDERSIFFEEEMGEGGRGHADEMGGEEGLGDEEAKDEMSLLNSSEEDADQKRRYKEYLALLKEIDAQNKTVEDFKAQIMELCRRPCKGRCEMKQIKHLHSLMEQENLKLQCLITKAMQLQNYGSKRRYKEVQIATTITEDQMAASYVGCLPENSGANVQDESEGSLEIPCNRRGGKEDSNQRKINNALEKLKVCCPEDRKLIEEIAGIFLKSTNKESGPCSSPPCGKRSKQPCKTSKGSEMKPCPPATKKSSGGSPQLSKLKQKIMCMQNNVSKLMQEINKRENGCNGRSNEDFVCPCKEDSSSELGGSCDAPPQASSPCRPTMSDDDPVLICGGKKNSKSNQIEKLKQNYLHLLTQYDKKNTQCREMEKRIKSLCSGCGGGGGGNNSKDCEDTNDAELELLRERVMDLKEEQAEFKCLIKEQAQQLEDYRQKYLMAQQTVEEQCVMLEKLNMNNKRIEKQINIEVKEIRAKFQEKLNELMHLPKLLENEQLKLAKACKEKEDIQAKLGLVCKELKDIKGNAKQVEVQDCRPKLLQCTMELEKAKANIEELTRQRDLFCEQLTTTQDDLDTLRSESAKIIARTKERAELIKQQQQDHINRLEKELAQCRATASLSVTDREAVIREMQGQLNTLSYSFDAAQKQIKTLRNHIAYVSNENCFPVKC